MSGLISLLCRLMADLWSARSGDVGADMAGLWSARSGDVGADLPAAHAVPADSRRLRAHPARLASGALRLRPGKRLLPADPTPGQGH